MIYITGCLCERLQKSIYVKYKLKNLKSTNNNIIIIEYVCIFDSLENMFQFVFFM